MKVFRPKAYVTNLKDSKLEQNSPKRYTPVCWDVWECALDIIYSDLYSKEMEKSGPLVKKTIRSLIKDLKNGYLYTDSPVNKDSDTHIIYELSDKHNLTWNKRINSIDRLTYSIHEPVLKSLKDGENPKLVIEILILSCKEHKKNKTKTYSE